MRRSARDAARDPPAHPLAAPLELSGLRARRRSAGAARRRSARPESRPAVAAVRTTATASCSVSWSGSGSPRSATRSPTGGSRPSTTTRSSTATTTSASCAVAACACATRCAAPRCSRSSTAGGRPSSVRPSAARTSQAGCEFCGACVSVCPTGALADKVSKWDGAPDGVEVSTCPFCCLGCQLELAHSDGALSFARGAHDAEINDGQLCVRGRFCLPETTHHHARARRPMLPQGRLLPRGELGRGAGRGGRAAAPGRAGRAAHARLERPDERGPLRRPAPRPFGPGLERHRLDGPRLSARRSRRCGRASSRCPSRCESSARPMR